METIEIELDIAKNQIGIDFDSLEKETLEESTSLPKELIRPVNHDWIKDEVLFVVASVTKDEVCPNFSDTKICGKTPTEWVLMAGGHCQKVVVDDCNIMDNIRMIQTDKKIIAVFYNDTPLLDRKAFYRIMDHFSSRSINFLQLERGFIVKTAFLKNNPAFVSGSVGGYEDEALFVVNTAQDFAYVHQKLNNKILSYHIANGVVIFGSHTVFIDADCEIDSGVVIQPNNVVAGQSIISSGCVLESGNVVCNSIIAPNCTLQGAYIKNSKITQGKMIDGQQPIVNREI